MKILVVLACVAVASARPEAPLQGYNYAAPRPAPQPVYHAPAPAPVYHQPAPAPVYHQPAPVFHQQTPSFHSSGFGSSVSSSGSAFSGSVASAGSGFGSLSSSGSGFGSAISSGGSFAPQQTVVQKHIYVHVPPQEPEEIRSPQILSQGVARKHYKIIFIKTPNVQPSAAQIALQQAQQEEKTIVYVLVKKPDEQGEINIPQLAPLPPSKPEVYFIKYKANKGAAGAIASGISGAIGSSGASAISSSSAHSGHSGHSGFDASIGSSSAGAAISHVGQPHTDYGAPAGHPGYQ